MLQMHPTRKESDQVRMSLFEHQATHNPDW